MAHNIRFMKDTAFLLRYLVFGIRKRLVIFGDNFSRMTRQIIFHVDYFADFYKELDIKVKQKVQYVLELIAG